MAIGLALDIGGVLFLGVALAATSDARLIDQASPFWDLNIELLRFFVLQRTDTRIGLPLLGTGFGCQLAAVLGVELDSSDTAVAWVMAIAWMLGAYIARRNLAEARSALLLGQETKTE